MKWSQNKAQTVNNVHETNLKIEIESHKLNKMEQSSNLIRVYTGTELTVNLLKDELESVGIPSMVQNDFISGVSAGFAGGLPSSIDLFIQESDLEQAEPIINEFNKTNS